MAPDQPVAPDHANRNGNGSPPDGGGEPSEVAALRAALDAERAGAAHWRRVAQQRDAALTSLKRRRAVRAALALDRRTVGLRARARTVTRRARATAEQVALAAAAVPDLRSRTERRTRLDAAVAALPEVAADPRSVLVVVVDHGPATTTTPAPDTGGDPSLPGTTDRPHTEVVVVRAPGDVDPAPAVQGAVRSHPSDLVCLVDRRTEVLTPDWLDRLAGALHHEVAAATPLLVHPARPLASATGHDLRVRSAGLAATVDADGAPHLRPEGAGEAPDPSAPVVAVTAAAGACLLLDRRALDEAGGLVALGDLDASAVDLTLRLRAAGRATVCVPGAVALDHRPVADRAALDHPFPDSSPTWQALVERHGPALVRAATAVTGLRVALTVASPTSKVAARWGDWHLAEGLARALERRGHTATVQTLAAVDTPASRSHDVQVVLRGLAPVRRTPGQRHVLWVISHPEDVDATECDEADLVVVASERFAAELRTRTATPVGVLLQATDPSRFHPRPADPAHRHPVTIVAKSRDVTRPMVADAIAAGLRPAIYGSGWEGLVDPSFVVSGYVPNEDLPAVYCSADVVLNDHWDTMRTWGFVSNRIFDVAACGTPVVSDDLPELHDLFGDLVPTWRDADDLARVVAEIRADPARARSRAEAARALVLAHHTFDNRADELLDLLDRHPTTG